MKFLRLVLCLLSLTVLACATSLSFTGTIGQDDQVVTFWLSLPSSSDLAIRTFGYAGGVNAAGTTIPAGGFDPGLALFDSTGLLIALNDDGGCGTVGADPATGACLDSVLNLASLAAGSYTLALFESPNGPVGPTLADGFQFSGMGNYTCAYFAGGSGGFCDATLAQRTNAYAVDIVSSGAVSVSSVPESGSSSFALVGLAAIILAVRRKTAV